MVGAVQGPREEFLLAEENTTHLCHIYVSPRGAEGWPNK